MKIVGLCGGSGSGKGAVGELFLKRGVPVIDTDAVYHELTSAPSECLSELVSVFGESVIDENGALNRRELGKIVFAPGTADKLAQLNSITHKHILNSTRERLHQFSDQGAKMAVVDAPLLFESGFSAECDVIISVLAEKDTRIERIMMRDGIDRQSAERRIASQLDDKFLIRKSDFVIRNNGTFSELLCEFEKIFIIINTNDL